MKGRILHTFETGNRAKYAIPITPVAIDAFSGGVFGLIASLFLCNGLRTQYTGGDAPNSQAYLILQALFARFT